MGKGKKHNKLYITASEHVNEWGGKREGESSEKKRRLPYYCCALTLQPFEHPVCTKDGVIYELLAIIPFLKKHKVDPITGEPLHPKDLLKLHFHKNNEGKYHCPITHREFTDYTHIVAIKKSGNVYAMNAIDELNIKAKNWTDLIGGQPFTRSDIIQIQDPLRPTTRDFAEFYHVKMGLQEDQNKADAMDSIRDASTRAILKAVKEDDKTEAKSSSSVTTTEKIDTGPRKGFLGNEFFTGVGQRHTTVDDLSPEKRPGKKTKKKGYVTLETNLGKLNFELFCPQTPKTCENFISHCKNGYYNGVTFHRNIPGFMIQGGDPTGTGTGGESIWGKNFFDEIDRNLHHDKRGILSMANRGEGTNSSQFFVTYKRCSHLDKKHSVFGRVVGGMDTLTKMEKVENDSKDKPLTPIVILRAQVFVDPFDEEEEANARTAKRTREEAACSGSEKGMWFSNPTGRDSSQDTTVGKYLKTSNSSVQPTKKAKTIDFGAVKSSTGSNGTSTKKAEFSKRFGKW